MSGKKFHFKVRSNPDLNRYTDQVLFPEQVARATEFIEDAGLPDGHEITDWSPAGKQAGVRSENSSLYYFINRLHPVSQSTDAINHFPDDLLHDFLYAVDKTSDDEIKIILDLLLTQRTGIPWNSVAFQNTFSLADSSYNQPAAQPSPAGRQSKLTDLNWVLQLLPAFPLEAIKSIDAYLLANWAALPALYAEALTDCEAIIRTKYLGHVRPSQVLSDLSSQDFELLVAAFYELVGYRTQVSSRLHDNSIDIQAFDPKNPDSQLLLIQCKSSDRAIGIADAKRLFATVTATESARGILVTTSRFSAEARRFAGTEHLLELIDGERLASLLTAHLGVYWSSKVDRYISKQKLQQLNQW